MMQNCADTLYSIRFHSKNLQSGRTSADKSGAVLSEDSISWPLQTWRVLSVLPF